MKRIPCFFLCVLLLLLPYQALAADWPESEGYYSVFTEDGELLFTRGGEVSLEDEYISGDNQLYRITQVNEQDKSAIASWQGEEEMPSIEWLKMAFAASNSQSNPTRLIAMYATHTDESYVPTDGTSSDEQGEGGILDVAEALKKALEGQGVEVILDKTSHLPHDSGAYRRSRQTAVSLLKQNPDALLDIHRDGTPADQYVTEVDGVNASKIRLLVGRSNQNSEANKDFAKKIKAVADEQYPGLIKDIYIGKGNYNQELMPQAILLEMGTHTISKERAVQSAEMMATVLTSVIYGDSQSAGTSGAKASTTSGGGIGKGMIWLLVSVVVAVIAYAFLATGSGKGMMEKMKRNTSEITGGILGKKPDKGGDKRN